MSGPYGYTREAFLALEPDEVAAAIFPDIKKQVESSTYGKISDWNILLAARTQLGDKEAAIVAEGWQWLVTQGFIAPSAQQQGWFELTRRGKTVDLQTHIADARALGLLGAAQLDPELRRVTLPAFRRGQYDLAVLAAMREVEERVRHVSGLGDQSGVPLMRAAFGTGCPLEDKTLDAGERRARADLFAGAFGVHRNATGHQAVDYRDPQEAAEAVLLANNLLRHLDRAARATRRPGRPRTRRTRTP
jgi:uncharacterized protein (TIGR02391 family)